MSKKLWLLIIAALAVLLSPKEAFAAQFDLIAPSGTLTRGQQVPFTINIDTLGKSLTSSQVGLTYDTNYLELTNVVGGTTFPEVAHTALEGGKILITGTSQSGFSGTGLFATVNFKLIAQAPGSTELCVLWAPSTTPTPTLPPGVTPTAPLTPTAPPRPTALPKTGVNETGGTANLAGIILIFSALALFITDKVKNKQPKTS